MKAQFAAKPSDPQKGARNGKGDLYSCHHANCFLLLSQVLREVAVLDAINRGGSHSMRIRQLGPFSSARRCACLLRGTSSASSLAD